MDLRFDNHIVRGVIALPLQLGRDATRLGFGIAGRAAGVGVRAVGRLIGPTSPDPSSGGVEYEETSGGARVDVTATTPETTPAPPPAPEAVAAAPADTTEPGLDAVPAHVSEEPELVDSYAEPGAEDGPGASVHVVEPWKGYGHMTADDVVARLTAASPEELAAVELYERLHRGRRTVLTAAGRQLRRASPPRRQRG